MKYSDHPNPNGRETLHQCRVFCKSKLCVLQCKYGIDLQNNLASERDLLHNACVMTQATDVTGELLKAVSRSFYLTIRFLPRQMRPAVALGYMLARATDSVADTVSAPVEQRKAVLARMGEAVAGTPDAALLQVLTRDIAPGLAHEGERTLLCAFGNLLQVLASFDAEQAALIRKVLSTIINGQLWDLTAFTVQDTVQNDDETRCYTYNVAGCVGEFWTHLGYTAMGERFCDAERREIMARAGVRYGQGLQLINILRDMEEDAARGRHYLCSSPATWLNRAERYMLDGVDYSLRLGTFRLRFASILPALIGLKTIKLLKANTLGQGKVKIKRRSVYACLLKAFFLCLRRKG